MQLQWELDFPSLKKDTKKHYIPNLLKNFKAQMIIYESQII